MSKIKRLKFICIGCDLKCKYSVKANCMAVSIKHRLNFNNVCISGNLNHKEHWIEA